MTAGYDMKKRNDTRVGNHTGKRQSAARDSIDGPAPDCSIDKQVPKPKDDDRDK